MLSSPTNLYPSILTGNDTIDATKDNEFSFQINGNSKVIQYRCIIYLSDAQSSLVYDTGIQTLAEPIYPKNYLGEIQRIAIIIPSTSGMINGNEYKYTIEVFDGSMSVVTPEEPFRAVSSPILNLPVPNTITSKYHEFIPEYIQDDKSQVKYFTWLLKNITTNSVIRDTKEIYSQDIRFSYDGFLSNNDYSIRLIVVNQDNISLDTGEIEFNVQYNVTPISGFIKLEEMLSHSALKVIWSPEIIVGKPIGNGHEFIDDNGYISLMIPKGAKLFFDTKNEKPLNLSASTTHIFKTRVYPETSADKKIVYRASGKLGNNDYFIEIYARSYSLYLNVNNEHNTLLCHQTSFEDLLTIIISPTETIIRTERKTGGLYPNNGLYPDDGLYPRDDTNDIIETFTVSSLINVNANYNLLELFGYQIISYLWVCKDIPDSDILNDLYLRQHKPLWDENTELLALFNGDYNAGNTNIDLSQFVNWKVYREDINKGVLEHAGTTSATDMGIIDYFISSYGLYRYYVYPTYDDKIGLPLISDPISINYREWTLITSNEINNAGNVLTHYRTYRFIANIQASDMPNNNQPNILQGFAKHPKFQPVNHNYLSGQLTSLIGIFDENCEGAKMSTSGYITTKDLSEELYELSTDGRSKFLKDCLGRIIEVVISAPISQKPSNGSDFYYDITIPWTQVGTIDNKSMAGIIAGDII